MSKKCCGMIYADEDTVCKICGKPLSEEVKPEQKKPDTDAENDMPVEEEQEDSAAAKAAVDYSKLKEETDKVVADVLRMQEEAEKNAEAASDFASAAGSDTGSASDEAADAGVAGEEETADEGPAADEDTAEESGEEVPVRQPGKAPGGMKAAGILAILAAVLGMAAIVLGIIFFWLFPEYSKRGNSDMQMNFPEIATDADATALRPVLTPTDVEINESFDASATATDADAQTSEPETEEAE